MAIISVLAELSRLKMPYVPAGKDEIKVLCPFHDDKDPSCCLNTEKLVFNCKSCHAAGDFVKWLARKLETDRATVWADLSKRYDLEEVKVVDTSVVEEHHQFLLSGGAGPLVQELYNRGITDEDIREHRIGVIRTEARISLPIKNPQGQFVNIRRYLPGAPGPEKMKNLRGRGQMRIHPCDQMRFERVVVCGGELKAYVTKRLLNPHDVGAVCQCGGEGDWDHRLTKEFAGKVVYVMMDVDEAGRNAANRIAALLWPVVAEVWIVTLPLDRDKYPKGDVNDFVGREGGDPWAVLQDPNQTVRWHPPTRVLDEDEEPADTRFCDTLAAGNVGRRMRFSAVVSAMVERPFVVPKLVRVHCGKGEECCPLCAVFGQQQTDFPVSAESEAILQMVSAPKEKLDQAERSALGIPRKCKDVTLETLEHWSVEDVRVNPSLEITNSDGDRTLQQALCVSCDAELNETYEFVGRLYPHPQTQQAALVVSRSKTTHDALSRYEPKRLSELGVFQPNDWTAESLGHKLDDVYGDLAANVTRIFERRDVHLFVDLSYFSPLLVSVDGKDTKGWTDILVVGDSSCGKTEVANCMRAHYGLGVKSECKNASVAGLLGGLRQMGTQWFVAWGVIPTNDRRHVTLDEANGISTDNISRFTDMRSSGIAEIPKIERRMTHARTRLLWLANGRLDRHSSTYTFGVEMVRDLVGAPQDVRRFDAALVVASSDVKPEDINRLSAEVPKGEPRYPGELQRELILWAWTRQREQVRVDPVAAVLITREAAELCNDYSEQIPLVDRGSMRAKLTRLSAALACRTFSCAEDDQHSILVRECHVAYAVATLRRVYSSKTFGYKFFSEAVAAHSQMLDADEIRRELECLKDPEEVRERLLHSDAIDIVDIQDWCGYDRTEAQKLLSLLVRKRAILRDDKGRKYRKLPDFISWLRSVELADAPEHIKAERQKF